MIFYAFNVDGSNSLKNKMGKKLIYSIEGEINNLHITFQESYVSTYKQGCKKGSSRNRKVEMTGRAFIHLLENFLYYNYYN